MQRTKRRSRIRLLQDQALPAVQKFLGAQRPCPDYAMHLHADADTSSICLAFQPSGWRTQESGSGTLMIDVAPETLAFRAQFDGGPSETRYSYFLPPIRRTQVEHAAIIERLQVFVEDGIDYFQLQQLEEQDFDAAFYARPGFPNNAVSAHERMT